MGPRNLLILFFSTVAVSLVILIIFFSLFFKNVDLNFNTRLPDSAPDVGGLYRAPDELESALPELDPNSKTAGLMRSSVHVPPDHHEPAAASRDEADSEGPIPADLLPPISDDAMLDDGGPIPPMPSPSAESTSATSTPASSATPALQPLVPPSNPAPSAERARPAAPPATEPAAGPPVPLQQGQATPPPTQASTANSKPSTTYRVVLGHYDNRESASAAAERVSGSGVNPIIRPVNNRFTVQLGNFSSRQNAEALARQTGASIVEVAAP